MSLLFPRLNFADDALALRVEDATLSYAMLAARAGGFAASLAEAGIVRGDRVGVFSDAHPDTVIAMMGAIAAGVTVVPLNPKLGSKERGHILRDSAPKRVYSAVAREVEGVDVESISNREAPLPRRETLGDEVLVLYTSGTTGLPKGAILRDTQVAANIDGLAEAWAWTDEDVVVHALPLFHVHGLVLGLFGSLRVGGALWTFERFDVAAVADALAGDGTMFFAVPTMHHRWASAAEEDSSIADKMKCARLLISGSAGLPVREHRRIEALIGRAVFERYGLTETLINCAVPEKRGPMPGTVGFPLRGVELRLVDDARQVLECHDGTTIGEIAVRGPSVFGGYLGRQDATEAAMDGEGWFYTGDLATRDEEGAIRIMGRRSVDLIKTGGYKVGAGEVEACILEVEGVAECAVVGVPDADLGQRIEAHLVCREGAEIDPQSVVDRVASELTPHKRPRAVHFVDALPRNAMGKVQKKRLLPPS